MDVLFINPESCRSKGFTVGIHDCDAEGLSLDQSASRAKNINPRLVVKKEKYWIKYYVC